MNVTTDEGKEDDVPFNIPVHKETLIHNIYLIYI